MRDKPMKLFLISQTENNEYDTYDSAVVCAPNEDAARLMSPADGKPADFGLEYSSWCSAVDKVTVQLIGNAASGLPLGVVCASFNAG